MHAGIGDGLEKAALLWQHNYFTTIVIMKAVYMLYAIVV